MRPRRFFHKASLRHAYVPDLPGCATTGRTLEETKLNIREEIEGHLRTLREFGDPAPEPSSLARDHDIRVAPGPG